MTDQQFVRRTTVPQGHKMVLKPKTVRYIGGQCVEAPFDPTDQTQQVYRSASPSAFTWKGAT